MRLRLAVALVGVLAALSLVVLVNIADARASQEGRIRAAILRVFGPRYGPQAIRVVRCETGGTFSIWAGYGRHEYLGLFQQGASERRYYFRPERDGHWWGWWAQIRAAHRHFVATGRDWSPWSCKP